jgi:hypothetical protein
MLLKTNFDLCQIDYRGNFFIRQLIERYRKLKKDIHMIFINMKKAYDEVSKNVWVL